VNDHSPKAMNNNVNHSALCSAFKSQSIQ